MKVREFAYTKVTHSIYFEGNNKENRCSWNLCTGYLSFGKNLFELVRYRFDDVSRELLPVHLGIVDPVVSTLPRSLLIIQNALVDHGVEEVNYRGPADRQ